MPPLQHSRLSERMLDGSDDTKLLIAESPYQFLPSLAQMFEDTGAVILQQLHYVSLHPFFHGERLKTRWKDGLFWVRIETFMFCDSLDGFCRHLSKSTFERHRGKLIAAGVLLVDQLKPSDNSKWYAINYERLKELEGEFFEKFNALKAEREAQRAEIETESRGSEYWRPVSGEDTSIHIDSWHAPDPQNVRLEASSGVDRASRHFDSSLESNRRATKVQSGPPAKAKAAHPSLSTKISKDILRTTTSEPIGSADVGEKSIDFLETATHAANCKKSEVVEAQNAAPSVNETKPQDAAISEAEPSNAQSPLPGVTVIMSETGAPRETADLAQRFITYAEEFGFEVTVAQAVRIVSKSEWAKAKQPQIEQFMKKEYSKLGFKTAIGGDVRKDMLDNIDRLRFHLFLWPGHVQQLKSDKKKHDLSSPGYFIYRWEKHIPLGQFVQSLIQHDNLQQQKLRDGMAAQQAEQFVASLTPPQKRALDFELQASPLRSRDRSRVLSRGTEEYETALASYINDPQVRERILAAGDVTLRNTGTVSVTKTIAEHEAVHSNGWHPGSVAEERRLLGYASRIVSELGGSLTEDEITRRCDQSVSSKPQAKWVEERVREAWTKKKAHLDEIRTRVLTADEIQSVPDAPETTDQANEPLPVEGFEPEPDVASRCIHLYLPPILKSLQNGEIEELDVVTECAKISGLSLQEAAWLEKQILTLWAQEKAA